MSVFEFFPDVSVDFSKALGIPIYGDEGRPLGKLKDFFVDYEEI
jgi:sporulation protein YlmC with PRC-barrel domain